MKLNNKKAFTLIELLVVMSVIAILVLLAMPKFRGYTEKARLTEIKSNIKQLENASERYYLDNDDWPRASDAYYTADQLETFAKEIKNRTGAVVTLEKDGHYYPISYTKLQKYVQVPKDGVQYILQNPVGEVFYLSNLTPVGKAALTVTPNNLPIKQFSNKLQNTFAILEDGTILGWGHNGYGQLGTGDTITQLTSVKIPDLTNVKQIVTGGHNTFILLNDGTVMAMGWNYYGQLGVGNTVTQFYPVKIPSLTNVKEIIATGISTFAILNDGTVMSWGNNEYGQLGIGINNSTQLTPAKISGLTNVKQIIAGEHHTLLILNDGTVLGCGSNYYGEFGLRGMLSYTSPIPLNDFKNFKQIAVGNEFTLVLLNDGTVMGAGITSKGQLGLYDTNLDSLTKIPNLNNVKQIATGNDFALALLEDGTVMSWGNNAFGQLGIGNTTMQTPIQIPNLTNVKEIFADNTYTSFALLEDGTLMGWGKNDFGALGIDNTTNQLSPVEVKISLREIVKEPEIELDIKQLSISMHNAFVSLKDNSVMGWGYNYYGHLLTGDKENKLSPVKILNLENVKQVVTGGQNTFVVLNDGTVMSTGFNYYGQLGIGNNQNQESLVKIPNLENVKEIIATGTSTFAILNDGTVMAWGNNERSQLGLGNANSKQLTPVKISGLTNVKQIIAGENHTLAIIEDGTAMGWGANDRGQLGLGGMTNYLTPTNLNHVKDFEQIVAGVDFTLVLSKDRTVMGMGTNSKGQLGVNDGSTYKTFLTKIPNLTDVVQIVAGNDFALALLNDGTVMAWGNNAFGQLGIGNTTTQNSPIKITSLTDVKQIFAGYNYSFALLKDGTLLGWGKNTNGDLGVGNTDNQLTPVEINLN